MQYVTSALKHAHVVGVHWHQSEIRLRPEGLTVNFQVGFVDCCNTPYPKRSGIREVGYRMYEIRGGK